MPAALLNFRIRSLFTGGPILFLFHLKFKYRKNDLVPKWSGHDQKVRQTYIIIDFANSNRVFVNRCYFWVDAILTYPELQLYQL